MVTRGDRALAVTSLTTVQRDAPTPRARAIAAAMPRRPWMRALLMLLAVATFGPRSPANACVGWAAAAADGGGARDVHADPDRTETGEPLSKSAIKKLKKQAAIAEAAKKAEKAAAAAPAAAGGGGGGGGAAPAAEEPAAACNFTGGGGAERARAARRPRVRAIATLGAAGGGATRCAAASASGRGTSASRAPRRRAARGAAVYLKQKETPTQSRRAQRVGRAHRGGRRRHPRLAVEAKTDRGVDAQLAIGRSSSSRRRPASLRARRRREIGGGD